MLLLHGWPGDRTDYRLVAPLVAAAADVIVPDLRGLGESDKHEADPAEYNAVGQARSIVGLIDELGLQRPVQPQREFWYQSFHRLELSTELIDGKPDAVRAYLRHFWSPG